jgi:hypothetical protein
MMGTMHAAHRTPSSRDRRLVQQLIEGRIPVGKEFDECRSVLRSDPAGDEAFHAMFTLLRGALADPFLGMEETRQVVPILTALSRGEVTAAELM